MQLTKLTIDNHRFTLVIFSLLLFAGIKSFVTMPRTENPEIVIPGASVICYYPGASPVDLEELVASPIEEAINELDDIKKIKTDLIDGVAIITVEFDFNTDADEKYDELSQKITGMENDLPEEILDIYTWQWNSTDVAMLQLAMTSKQASYREIEQQAELLKNDLEKVQGVKKVEIIANPEQEVRVSLDLEKMAQMNITIEQVANAIKSNNANIPGGNINLGEKTFSVKTSGSISDLEQIRNTVVNSYMGRLIYLKNIAQVSFNHEDMRYYARYNLADNELNDSNEKAVFVIVKQKEGLNVLDITDACKPKIEDFNKTQTSDISVKYVFDQSVGVRGRINSFLGNLLQGIILVGLVIFIALGVKSAFVVIIAIPLSIVIGLAVVDYSGFGLQQISIAGLVVALGLLVDNSIVMVENINRHIAKGLKPREASISAATEIGWPIISATITTVLAFVPIAMMPDKAGEFIKSLPLTIIATLMISLVIALTLTPMITSKLFKGKKLNETNEPEKLKGFHKFLTKFIEGPYRKTLQFALNHRFMTISLAVGLLGISLFFFTFVNKSFFPKAEQPNLMIRISLPEGTN
ncbi:MAG: efflux RND transporter permease subunit, partial [Bacteroidales bacterium]|nr:efflux RND transporter permease subunit [Bacteroidales bacterium]